MNLAFAIPILCGYGLLVAAVELEIEGPFGWAQRLPTWYRVSGPVARLYRRLTGGRPLTGYHVVMVPALLLSFHLPFAFGVPWSLGEELRVLAVWAAWVPYWDFLWFMLNPAWGPRHFRRGLVWWHPSWLGPLPRDYWAGIAGSLVLAAVANLVPGEEDALADQVILLAAFIGVALVTALLSGPHARWHRHTHAPEFDERARVSITPPPAAGTGSSPAGGPPPTSMKPSPNNTTPPNGDTTPSREN